MFKRVSIQHRFGIDILTWIRIESWCIYFYNNCNSLDTAPRGGASWQLTLQDKLIWVYGGDVNGEALGSSFMQGGREVKEMHPVAFALRKLSYLQKKYSTTERECFGILRALKYFRHYVWGMTFEVVTDLKEELELDFSDPKNRDDDGVCGLGEMNWNFFKEKE
ncbi:Retrovirus-related Pol polyprotein from transposon 17.6 [Eumeta japonica]|uniref:Retrovirus-related Pol polyprotein from transposon 17.6 n=1 Tax=Eumeta variegata TaxID=151549 RepID=A0A4C1YZH6_EUMVA|nr:Retrovirus-related Pol polyprotein from transposon 17.6 [Eumeta japonica]